MNGWTPERKARQSLLIQQWQPWKQSTGPKSPAGKRTVAGNAWKGGHRQELRDIARWLREQRAMIEGL